MEARRYVRSQRGYTLIELIITAALGALLLSALTSVVLTTWRAVAVASSRVEASGQIRNFAFFAYDDFAGSGAPTPGACGTPANPCTTQPLALSGLHATGSTSAPTEMYQVTYSWDGSNFLDRQVGGGATRHAATNVTAFSWFVDTNSTVVVSIKVTIDAYSQYQTFRFYPRMSP